MTRVDSASKGAATRGLRQAPRALLKGAVHRRCFSVTCADYPALFTSAVYRRSSKRPLCLPAVSEPVYREKPRSNRLSPAVTRSATISPTTDANLKPWPEHADTTCTRSWPGSRSMMKCSSGVFVKRHTEPARRARAFREIAPCERMKDLDVRVMNAAIDGIRVHALAEMVISANLEAGPPHSGKSVVRPSSTVRLKTGKRSARTSAGRRSRTRRRPGARAREERAYQGMKSANHEPALNTRLSAA